jgi:hypothetical protein
MQSGYPDRRKSRMSRDVAGGKPKMSWNLGLSIWTRANYLRLFCAGLPSGLKCPVRTRTGKKVGRPTQDS